MLRPLLQYSPSALQVGLVAGGVVVAKKMSAVAGGLLTSVEGGLLGISVNGLSVLLPSLPVVIQTA